MYWITSEIPCKVITMITDLVDMQGWANFFFRVNRHVGIFWKFVLLLS